LEKGIKVDEMLHDACIAIDAMGENAVNDVKMWFSNFMLRAYQEIFEPGKPDSEFENSRRRFSWLKRTLKDYDEKYMQIFPSHWYMQ
jgi:vacuolar protein sorting-associated protein 53